MMLLTLHMQEQHWFYWYSDVFMDQVCNQIIFTVIMLNILLYTSRNWDTSLSSCCFVTRDKYVGLMCRRSYGVVLWEIVTLAALPYCGSANEKIVENVKNGIRNKLDPVPECPPLL